LPPPDRVRRLILLGQTAEIRGERELARKYYEQASALDGSTATRAGDLVLRDKDWQAAATAYERAAKATAGEAIATYLHGYCLEKSGQAEAGRELMRTARLAALAPEMRLQLANGLSERGLKEEAAKHLELIRRTALPDSGPAATAAQQHGNLIGAASPGEAASAWRHLQLHVLNATTNYGEVEGYLLLGHMIHKMRVAAAIADGERARVEEELAACENLVPGDVQATVELAPKLDKAGFAELSEELLARGMQTHEGVMQEFPRSATYFNNAAWMCARAQRKLDQALDLVQRAIVLAPQEASYQDTLAEVRFQRGDREGAVAAAKKAVEFAPHSALFAKRLKHFEEDEVRTLDGVEE
jgi:tetratricopeptide (TPR) repeat protein